MTVEEFVNRIDDGVAALEKIAETLEDLLDLAVKSGDEE